MKLLLLNVTRTHPLREKNMHSRVGERTTFIPIPFKYFIIHNTSSENRLRAKSTNQSYINVYIFFPSSV